jgi:hypothetical protein
MMGVNFENLFGVSGGDGPGPAAVLAALADLDVDLAIATHINLQTLLQTCIKIPGKKFALLDNVCSDAQCELGRWIYGKGQGRIGRLPGFKALLGNHKMLHYAASNVIALSEAGKTAEAQSALEGPLDTYLMAVVRNLLALRSAARSPSLDTAAS